MLIAILIISILSFLFILFIYMLIFYGLRETNERIANLEITLDEIKEKTDRLGTYGYESVGEESKEQLDSEIVPLVNKTQEGGLFVGFIIDEETHKYEVYLVNPTPVSYSHVQVLTGGNSQDDNGLAETSKVKKEKGELVPDSYILLEKDNLDVIDDFSLWYHLDLYRARDDKPQQVWFEISRLSTLYWGGTGKYQPSLLPVLNKEGMRIELDDRAGEEIEEGIKHLNMSADYHKSAKS
jgi:hypothetical protein